MYSERGNSRIGTTGGACNDSKLYRRSIRRNLNLMSGLSRLQRKMLKLQRKMLKAGATQKDVISREIMKILKGLRPASMRFLGLRQQVSGFFGGFMILLNVISFNPQSIGHFVLVSGAGASFITLLSSCSSSKEANTFDNGSGPVNTRPDSMRGVGEVEFRVPSQNEDGKYTSYVSEIYYSTDSNRWQIDVEWLPEFQNRVDKMQIAIGKLPKFLDTVKISTEIFVMLQGIYDENKHRPDDMPVSVTHTDRGQFWVDNGMRTHVIVSEQDTLLLNQKFNAALRIHSENIVALVRADLHNGAMLAEYICGLDDPRFDGVWSPWVQIGSPEVVNATCIEDGKTTTKFQKFRCAQTEKETRDSTYVGTLPATGHDFSEWVEASRGEKKRDGHSLEWTQEVVKKRNCKCGETETDTLVENGRHPNLYEILMNADFEGECDLNLGKVPFTRRHEGCATSKSQHSIILTDNGKKGYNGGALEKQADVFTRGGRWPTDKDTIFYQFINPVNGLPTGQRTISVQSFDIIHPDRKIPRRIEGLMALPGAHTVESELHNWEAGLNPIVPPLWTQENATKFNIPHEDAKKLGEYDFVTWGDPPLKVPWNRDINAAFREDFREIETRMGDRNGGDPPWEKVEVIGRARTSSIHPKIILHRDGNVIREKASFTREQHRNRDGLETAAIWIKYHFSGERTMVDMVNRAGLMASMDYSFDEDSSSDTGQLRGRKMLRFNFPKNGLTSFKAGDTIHICRDSYILVEALTDFTID